MASRKILLHFLEANFFHVYIIYHLLTASEVITGCNDRTDEVNKLFIIWRFYCWKTERSQSLLVNIPAVTENNRDCDATKSLKCSKKAG